MASQSGTITAAGNTVTLAAGTGDSLVVATIYGTYGGFAGIFEFSIDGTNFFPVACLRMDGGGKGGPGICPADNAVLGWAFNIPKGGSTPKFRVRALGCASGTVSVLLVSVEFSDQEFAVP